MGIANPYRILVSEVMLQQTQVERVVPFYAKFIRTFPSTKALAKAPLPAVLKLWQGLGYNRRAKMLRDAARMIEDTFGGRFPETVEDVESLPGVGPYTARALAAFAFNRPEIFVETNIRTVFFHHFSADRKVTDAELLPLVAEALAKSKMQPREFYAALMDYGAYLKRQGVRLNHRSAHYAKQSKFKGSMRELRGALLRELVKTPASAGALAGALNRTLEEVGVQLERLEKEGLILQRRKRFVIAR